MFKAHPLPCMSPVLARVHDPSLSYLFRQLEQSKTNYFYGQQCWILQEKKGRVLAGFYLGYLRGRSFPPPKKNAQLPPKKYWSQWLIITKV